MNAHLEGNLTFAQRVKLYTHQCFHRYPHFQLSEIDPKLAISNNATSLHGGGRKGKGKERSHKGKGKSQYGNRYNNNRDRASIGDKPNQGKGKGKGRQKGKGRGTGKGGNRTNNETCSSCNIPGHSARDCRKRQHDEKEKQEKTPNKRGKEPRNHVQIVDELDLQFSQHVSYVEPATPEGKPMRTSPTTTVTPPDTLPTYNEPEETAPAPQAEDDMAETENREYYVAIIDGVRYLQYHTTNPHEEASKKQDQDTSTNTKNVPVGEVPMQPIASEAPQVSISTVETDKAAASQMAESGGQVATRPVPTTPSREATEDPSSLTEDPPHGLHTCEEGENGKDESSHVVFTSTDGDNESSTEPTWGATSYTPEPTWGKRQIVDREEELRQWQQINTNDTYVYRVCSTCGDSMLQRKENPSLTCRQCKALDVMEDQEGTRTGNSKKKGYEQMNRDDEEEYSRIPIAGENDSDYDVFEDLYDSSYSQESDEDESSSINKSATNYVAWRSSHKNEVPTDTPIKPLRYPLPSE